MNRASGVLRFLGSDSTHGKQIVMYHYRLGFCCANQSLLMANLQGAEQAEPVLLSPLSILEDNTNRQVS